MGAARRVLTDSGQQGHLTANQGSDRYLCRPDVVPTSDRYLSRPHVVPNSVILFANLKAKDSIRCATSFADNVNLKASDSIRCAASDADRENMRDLCHGFYQFLTANRWVMSWGKF